MMIKINNVAKNYGNKIVFKNLNFCADTGRVTCVLGESGSGKTTLLNMIAGLTSYKGEISGAGKISYIFQEARLIPNLTVRENLSLISNSCSNLEVVAKKLDMLDKLDRYPNTLSGGEKQRVSIARAFVNGGDTILMDEPFSNLDLKLKISVMNNFCSVRDKETVIFVTHSIEEALMSADRILVVSDGGIIGDFSCLPQKDYFADSHLKREICNLLLS